MHVYCLFCETTRCKIIAKYIERTSGYRCIYPLIMQRVWKKGVAFEEPRACLPGYLFLYTEEPIYLNFDISGIIRVLGRGELEGSDLSFAETVYQCNGVLGTIHLAQAGDRCYIRDPLWEKLQGTIVKVDRGRKRCCIEYEFDEKKRTLWAGYDLIDVEEKKPES